MADDQPSNWELARQLQDIKQLLAGVVGRPEYAADKRATDFRLSDVERDLAEERRDRLAAATQERRDRDEAIAALHERITNQAKAGLEHRMHWRSLLWTGALPAFVALIGVIVALIIGFHGGH